MTNGVRDFFTAMVWVLFATMLITSLYLLFTITSIFRWLDSSTRYNIGDGWYRFVEWYLGMILELFGIDQWPEHDEVLG